MTTGTELRREVVDRHVEATREYVRTYEEAMAAEARVWRSSIRSPLGARCRPACAVLSVELGRTMHEPGCAWEYAVSRIYELERGLGL